MARKVVSGSSRSMSLNSALAERAETAAPAAAAVDHRTRVGQARRAKTETRIIEAALRVFADKGPDAPVIEDFITAAGIARGTFYNYFKSVEELLAATSKWLGDDVVRSIEMEIGESKDPVYRMALGVRLWMKKAESDPDWCAFVWRIGGVGDLVRRQLTKDLKDGLKSGAFRYPSVEAAFDLVVGTIMQAMSAVLEHRGRRNFRDDVASIILQGLGVDSRRIEELTAIPLPAVSRPIRRVA